MTLYPYIGAYITERTALGRFTGKTPAITRERLNLVARFHGHRPLTKVTERAMLDWLASITHLAPATRCSYLSTARAFTGWMHQTGHLPADPCEHIARIPRPDRVPRALPADDVAACLNACADDRDRAIIWLAVGCGLRRGEIAGLTWADYDRRAATLFVTGKGGKERVVPVPPEVAPALRAIAGPATGPIIASHTCNRWGQGGRPVQPAYIGDIVRRICTDAGVKVAGFDGVSTHSFRHTCASDVLDHDSDLRNVQQMLGHASLPSTAIYLRIARLDDVRAAMTGRDYQHALPEAA